MMPSLTVHQKRNKPGRPKARYQGTRLSAWVPNYQYDKLCSLAKASEKSVSGLVRDMLKLKLR
jgi:hypothetical protein